nr:phosphopantetheine-binding protein [Robiginitalea marina]
MKIISPYLPEDVGEAAISPGSDLIRDLNINSSHLVDIILDVEDHFNIMLEDQDMEALKTVEDALGIIEVKLGTTGNS